MPDTFNEMHTLNAILLMLTMHNHAELCQNPYFYDDRLMSDSKRLVHKKPLKFDCTIGDLNRRPGQSLTLYALLDPISVFLRCYDLERVFGGIWMHHQKIILRGRVNHSTWLHMLTFSADANGTLEASESVGHKFSREKFQLVYESKTKDAVSDGEVKLLIGQEKVELPPEEAIPAAVTPLTSPSVEEEGPPDNNDNRVEKKKESWFRCILGCIHLPWG